MNEQLGDYEAGTKISVPIVPPFAFPRHVGMLTCWETPQGELLILTTTVKRGVHLTTVREFADGQQIRVDGYPGTLEPNVVMQRGYNIIGTPYSKMNCDELVEYAHGRKVRSEQVEAVVGWAVAGALVWLGAKALSKA